MEHTYDYSESMWTYCESNDILFFYKNNALPICVVFWYQINSYKHFGKGKVRD